TVHYMAPEVSQGRYGRELDIYSLGVMAYEMLTGEVPFRGESVGEILMKHLTTQPDLGKLPAAFRGVVGQALEKDPLRRTASAQELARAFRQALTVATPGAVVLGRGQATQIPDSHFLDEHGERERGPGRGSPRRPTLADHAETWISPNPAQPAGAAAARPGGPAAPGRGGAPRGTGSRGRETTAPVEAWLSQVYAEMGRNPIFAIAVIVTVLTVLPFVPGVLMGVGGLWELMVVGVVWGSIGYVVFWMLRKPKNGPPAGPSGPRSPGDPPGQGDPWAGAVDEWIRAGNEAYGFGEADRGGAVGGGATTARVRPVGAAPRKSPQPARPIVYTHETPRHLSLTERGLDLCWSMAWAPLWAAPWGALMGCEARSGFSVDPASRGAGIWTSFGGWQSHLEFLRQEGQFSWLHAGFFWLLTTLAAWVLLVFSKGWEGRSLSTWGRRLTLACAGVIVGGVAWMLHDWLQLGPLPAARDWVGSLRGVETPHPERFVWAAQFALLFGGIRWWLQTDAFRSRRFRFFPLLTTSLVGALAGLCLVDSAPAGTAGETGIWPLALGACIGPAIAATVQCSAIFVPKPQRGAYLATRRPIQPLPRPLTEGVA
ncbi:MAG: protein kinase domain-containing protein, partial [Planctomycetaceae bacterium]